MMVGYHNNLILFADPQRKHEVKQEDKEFVDNARESLRIFSALWRDPEIKKKFSNSSYLESLGRNNG